jgi:hypothetical protein
MRCDTLTAMQLASAFSQYDLELQVLIFGEFTQNGEGRSQLA